MENTNTTALQRYKQRSKVSIANDFILLITITALIFAIIFLYVMMFTGKVEDITSDEKIIGVFIIPIFALMALTGVWSVVASNNKAPLALLALSSVSTLFKLMYPMVQIITGQDDINSTVIIGQSIAFITLLVQVYFWMQWNKQTDEDKFITQSFTGKRTYFAVALIGAIFIIQFGFSLWINGGDWWIVFMDVAGSMLYAAASILMAFGNIWCFVFFLLSDANWLFWTVKDLMNQDSLLMITMSLLTLLQVSAYIGLAFTGFIQWFIDDYRFENGKIIKLNRTKEI